MKWISKAQFDAERQANDNAFVDWMSWSWPASVSYGRIYNPETHDLIPKKEYLQKEIGELKTEKKRLEDRISEIDKETLELQKRLE